MTPSPFLTVWTRPRATVRRIITERPGLYVLTLAALGGVGRYLEGASFRNSGERMSTTTILLLAVVIGPIAGCFFLWLSALVVQWTGRWLGGIAQRQALQTAIAWGSVPVVVSYVLWIPELLLFGEDMFTEEMLRVDAQPILLAPLLMLMLAELSSMVWSIVLTSQAVAEVQGFRSGIRGCLNLLLAMMLLAIPLVVLVILSGVAGQAGRA